jgi:outer membrane murein-binding lipoprotein Lpp
MSVREHVRAGMWCAAALGLLFLAGCEDRDAREKASELSKTVGELQNKVSGLEADNKALKSALEGLPAKLAQQIDDRIAEASKKLHEANKELLTQLAQDAEKTRKDATGLLQSARDDYDKQLQAVKAALVSDLEKLRDESTKGRDGLKRYMDNQLRDLYPYAYQPHREAKGPPEADAGTK